MVRNRNWYRTGTASLALASLALAALALAAPIGATVRDGVEAWSRGDYAAAVAEWQGPADAGDADAMFNLAQAYRLGRGVPVDLARAEALYLRAAQAGHVAAADTYGLMLFQDGRRAESLPFVEDAARRGDPRARYLLGIAHFNGDLVPLDWERAYALLTLANAEGLPQAAATIAEMDAHIPLEQRQRAAALARDMQAEAEAARAVELTAADFAVDAGSASPANASARVPRPIPTTSVSPSVASARATIDEARRATGIEDPAQAGASFAAAPTSRPAPRAEPQVAAAPPPRAVSPAVPDAAPARSVATGPWRVQLGAFGVRSNAEALWARLAGRAELAGRGQLLIPAGRVTKLQAGGYATQAEAQRACRSLQAAGHDCLVTRN